MAFFVNIERISHKFRFDWVAMYGSICLAVKVIFQTLRHPIDDVRAYLLTSVVRGPPDAATDGLR